MREGTILLTAKISAASQVVLGLVSLIGFIRPFDEKTVVPFTLLVADTVVQVVEFLFYVFFIWMGKLETWYRYVDWFLTTPTMLISNMLFGAYLSSPEDTSISSFLSSSWKDVLFVIVLNSLMLSAGLMYELRWIPIRGLLLGWPPFLASFAVMFSFTYGTLPGALLTALMFLIWTGYGLAAFLKRVPKNVSYNLLDVLSKNFYGLVVSIYILSSS